MQTVASTVVLIATFLLPIFVEAKLFRKATDSKDHILNLLKRILSALALFWCVAYVVGLPILGIVQNPFGLPLQLTVLASFLIIPISILGYVVGRWRSKPED